MSFLSCPSWRGVFPIRAGVFRNKGLHVARHQHGACRQTLPVDESRPNQNIPNTTSTASGLEMRLCLLEFGARQKEPFLPDGWLFWTHTYKHTHVHKHTHTHTPVQHKNTHTHMHTKHSQVSQTCTHLTSES